MNGRELPSRMAIVVAAAAGASAAGIANDTVGVVGLSTVASAFVCGVLSGGVDVPKRRMNQSRSERMLQCLWQVVYGRRTI